MELSETIRKKFPDAVFDFRSCSDESAIDQVRRGEAHLAMTTFDVSGSSELTVKLIGEATFQTFVGKNHPLYARAKAGKTIPVEELLKHGFVSPTNPLLGQIGAKQSLDGWRDDRFRRRIIFRTSSLKILEEFVGAGLAAGYLPDYFCENLSLQSLKISSCPYSCHQKIRLVARDPKQLSWLNKFF